jgi:hypothetical protein
VKRAYLCARCRSRAIKTSQNTTASRIHWQRDLALDYSGLLMI